MKNLYSSYGEVLHIDATYKVNKSMYPLYHFVITDSYGLTRSIFYAFVKNEKQYFVDMVISIFCKEMDNINITKTVFVDKDSTEINAINKFLPKAKILLCSFHVEKAMKSKIKSLSITKFEKNMLNSYSKSLIYCKSYNQFLYISDQIEKSNKSYFLYLLKCWLSISDMWAHYLRSNLLTFEFNTNNRVEQAHGKIKKFLSKNSSLPVIIDEIIRYSNVITSECLIKENKLSMLEYKLSNDTILNNLLLQFSPYSWKKILKIYNENNFISMWKLGKYFFIHLKSNSATVYKKCNKLICDCSFFLQNDLPCEHIINVFKFNNEKDYSIVKSRWTVSHIFDQNLIKYGSPIKENNASNVNVISKSPTNESNVYNVDSSISNISNDEITEIYSHDSNQNNISHQNNFKKNKELSNRLLNILNTVGGNEYQILFDKINKILVNYENIKEFQFVQINKSNNNDSFIIKEVKTKGRPKIKKNYVKF